MGKINFLYMDELLILLGLILFITSIYLILHVYITKRTDNISFNYILLVVVVKIIVFLYGIMIDAYLLYIPAIILIIGLLYVFYMKSINAENDIIEEDLKKKDII